MMNRILNRLLSLLCLCVLVMGLLTTPAAAARFTDVPAGHWAKSAVSHCVEKGFFQGESNSRFGVGKPMARGAFAVVLCRFFGWEMGDPATLPFDDVPKNAWYAPALASALSHGAVTLQASSFRPNDPVTREELAAALVRGLGLAPFSGLAQELSHPFSDVSTNQGYITMAYDLGLVNGTGESTFSPDKIAAREQVAVILSRLDQKLHGDFAWSGLLSGELTVPLTGAKVVALGRGKLIYAKTPTIHLSTPQEQLDASLAAAKAAGVKPLLYLECSQNALDKGETAELTAAIAEALSGDTFAGVFLDLPELRAVSTGKKLTQLVQRLKPALEEKLLYVAAEAPMSQGNGYPAYDYAALSKAADRLVLRVHSQVETTEENLSLAPVDPLEEVYYALRAVKETKAAPEKLALWMTTSATLWNGSLHQDTLSGLETDALRQKEGMQSHYSQRYGCAYLSGQIDDKDVTVWYPDARSAAARVELAKLFGLPEIFLGELSEMSPSLLEGLQ